MSRGPVVGLVAMALVLVAAVAVFAVTRDSGDDGGGETAAPDTCGQLDRDALGTAAIGLGLDGGTGSCDDFGDTVTAADADTPVALRISYLNESSTTQQNVTLRLELPSALAPQTASTKLYDGAGGDAEPMATGFLMWQSDGLRLGSYEPDEAAVVVVYADVEGDFDAAGCETLRDPVKAYASSRGEAEVSATVRVQVGAGCATETSAS